MGQKTKKRLGEILMEDGLLTRENLDEALRYQRQEGGLIGQILIKLGYLTEEKLVAALGKQLKVPYLPIQNYSVNMDAFKLFNEEFCRKHNILAFDSDDSRVFLAIGDPLNDHAIEEARQIAKLRPQVFISMPTDIMNMLDIGFAADSGNKDVKKAG